MESKSREQNIINKENPSTSPIRKIVFGSFFVCLLPVLLFMSNLPWYVSLSFACVVAPIASLTELYTKGGWDTITVTIVSALILCETMFWG